MKSIITLATMLFISAADAATTYSAQLQAKINVNEQNNGFSVVDGNGQAISSYTLTGGANIYQFASNQFYCNNSSNFPKFYFGNTLGINLNGSFRINWSGFMNTNATYPNLLGFGESNSLLYKLFYTTADRNMSIASTGYASPTKDSGGSFAAYDTWYAFQLDYTTDPTNSNLHHITMTRNGESILSYTLNQRIDSDRFWISFGGSTAGDDKSKSWFKNVEIYSLQAIPEPATATLGLFGLSALMLRRRRK